jgi:heterodisulfide reductase subunit A
LNLNGKRVTILGAGITGLEAARHLAALGLEVVLIERSSQAGGHAAALSCKATDGCVRCGACLVQERLNTIGQLANVRILVQTQVTTIERQNGLTISYESPAGSGKLRSDAVLVATGFKVYDPTEKPYGYGQFEDVITHLEAEGLMKTHGELNRPSDGRKPDSIAFIQCVGSRDSRLGHPWCSKICCGSALRMGRLIQHRQPDTAVTFFYIDVQTFGRNFQVFYANAKSKVQMVRAIPGDIFKTADHRLQATFFDPHTQKSNEATFDLIILSVGLMPAPWNVDLARALDWPLTPWGFFCSHRDGGNTGGRGIFTAGAALGPMSISECIDSAGQAAWEMAQFLGS